MQYIWLSFVILGFASASPLTISQVNEEEIISSGVSTRNSFLENLVLGLLEDLRETMVKGSDDIPVLDPLQLDRVHLDDAILPIPRAHVTVNGLKVSQLSSFVVDTLSVSVSILQRYRVQFDIHIPTLEIEADNYDLAVTAAGAHLFGNGDAKINLIEPRVTGFLLLVPRITIGNGLFLRITTSEIKFNLKGFESRIYGLLNDDSMADFINAFLRHLVPDLIQMYEAEISKILSDTVQEIGNEILADINLINILG